MSDVKDRDIIDMTAVEQAIAEYDEIVNEAKKFAQETILNEMDEKVNSIVENYIKEKESEKTNINESEQKDQESAKADKKEEMSNTDSKAKEVGKVNESLDTLDLTSASINEIETAFDQANNSDELQVVKDPVTQIGSDQSGISADNLGDDEISIDDIRSELDSIEEIQGDLHGLQAQQQEEVVNNDPYLKMKQMHMDLGNMIKEMEDQKFETELKEAFSNKMHEMWGEGFEQKIGLDECSKMYETWKGVQAKGQTIPTGAPEGKDVVAEQEVDEAHGITLDHNKKVGQEKQPRVDQGKDYAKNRVRLALQKESVEHAKKLAAVLKENKDLNKKLNDLKKEKKQLSENVDLLKTSLGKMKGQMKDMATFNTNIAYTNNLLVNEELALTKEDKIKVINSFKSVKSVEESERTFNKLVEEFKASKKAIVNETIEQKVTNGSILGESNAKVIEKTAYANDPLTKHIGNIKRVMATIDKKR